MVRNVIDFFSFNPYRRIPEYRGVLNLKLTPKKILNFYLSKIAFQFGWESVPFAPWGIDVEPIRACNLACPLCPMSFEKYSRTVLSFERYKEIIEPIAPYLIMIDFSYWGEPFLNPELGRMIRYAKEKNIVTIVRGNLNFLPDKTCEELIDSACDLVLVGLDSPKEESYQKYRVKGEAEVVKRNIRKIQDLKKQKKSRLPHVLLYSVQTKDTRADTHALERFANECDIPRIHFTPTVLDFFLDRSRRALMEPTFSKKLDFIDGMADEEVLYKKRNQLLVERKNQHSSCWMPYFYPALSSDGRLNGCWHVFFEEDALTKEKDLSFWKMWNSPKAKQMRKYLRNREKSPGFEIPCERCTSLKQ